MENRIALSVLAGTLFVYLLYRRWSKISISDVPGPRWQSFWTGNIKQLRHEEVITMDTEWQTNFGNVARIWYPFGREALWISDPQAMKYILQKSGYAFEKIPERRIAAKLIGDGGLDGADAHVISIASFGYRTGCLENEDNELAKGYMNFLPSSLRLMFETLAEYLTVPIASALYLNLPTRVAAKLRSNRNVAHRVAEELLETKLSQGLPRTDKRDLMSIFAQACKSMHAHSRMSRYEVISQVRTIMFAGSETTTNALSFALLELAKYPHYQRRLRSEIRAMEETVRARGDEISPAEVEAMPFLQAFNKEVLRLHPLVPYMYRQPVANDIIPLSKPITTRSGKVIHELPVPAGLRLVLSIPSCNRDKDI
ncbi:hypothetical protein IEO21_09605 [Rhodonia placenta]|uniref:Cytochrome P450 n=1 Tax=Rhodonia placenta TaxID=104341 RepID=A0A8H7TY94_9APHY|nr:hypothetical protein IEO21_09605 [Postia placenta]